ncbi:hypothetical protein ABEB36_013022 [Hypothenemus hampei]|uniref:MADF domain-containing protein n=1 Tax=Hypothenemus hampei TaxID=57062 RepID=A0ABD1E7F7_HYPHA
MSSHIQFDDELLLSEICNYPALYKKQDPDYKSHIKKAICWDKVSAILKIDVNTAKARFVALREKFRRQLKIEDMKNRNGCAGGRIGNKQWEFMEVFRFMNDGNEPRKTTSNLPLESNFFGTPTGSESEIGRGIASPSTSATSRPLEHYMVFLDDNESPLICSPPNGSSYSSPSRNNKKISKKRKRKRVDESQNNISTVLTSVSDALVNLAIPASTVEKNWNELRIQKFCQYLQTELEVMKPADADIFIDENLEYLLKFKRNLRNK